MDFYAIDLTPRAAVGERVFKNVDGIKFLNHQGGCSGTRQDAAVLSRLLAAYADHPNVAGITVLSLGCQNLQVADFLQDLKLKNPLFDRPLLIYEKKEAQNEQVLIKTALRETLQRLVQVNGIERQPAPLNKLTGQNRTSLTG